jgi:hypothetical protein
MTSIDDLQHDLKGVSDGVLSDLDTEERLRVFIQEAAEDREERIEWLTETAPTKQYEATDLAYTDGIKRYSFLSLQARHELQALYQAITKHEADRDKHITVMLLNGALERLSQGHSPSTSTGTPIRRRHGLTTTDPSTPPTSRASPESTASYGTGTTSS